MHHRFRVSAGLLLVLVAVAPWATGHVAAQSPAKPYAPARTPDGQPDLQGFWTNSTYTPLERPDNVTKEIYTPDELAVTIKQAAERERAQTTPGTTADVHYDFSQFALDRSQSAFARNLRTSLIVNPENGKLPPLTAEGQKRAAERAEAAKRVGRWDSAESNQLDDRCLIMAGAGTADARRGLQQQLSNRAESGIRDDSHRDDPRRPRSSRWTAARNPTRTFVNGWGSRAAAGKARRWWWRRPISTARTRSEVRARTCA